MSTKTLPRHARTGVLAVGWRKARTGETEGELYPIWPVLGGAPDDDEEEETDGQDDEDDADTKSDDEDDGQDDGAEDLGDKGKQALARMKERLKAERKRRVDAEAERDTLKTKPADSDPERIRADADKAATARANGRIVRSEVKAAATGRLADPRDALAFIDLTQFEVDDDGQVDEDDVADAITQLLKDKPHLAAATAKRFQGTGDGGARKGSGGVKQLGKNDLKTMTAEQIDEARQKGQLRDYLNE